MRHKIKTDRFSRFSSYRKATIKSIAISVLINQKIMTTKAKAKSSRILIEQLITLGKKNTLAARRRAFSIICDHKLVKRLFDQLAPVFANRAGGYTRIMPYKNQRGDNAQLVILELTEKFEDKKPEKKIKEEKKPSRPVEVKEVEQVAAVEKEKPLVQEEKKEPPKEKPVKAEVPPKKEPPKAEEKKHAVPKEIKGAEDKKPKNMFGGFRKFFQKEK